MFGFFANWFAIGKKDEIDCGIFDLFGSSVFISIDWLKNMVVCYIELAIVRCILQQHNLA